MISIICRIEQKLLQLLKMIQTTIVRAIMVSLDSNRTLNKIDRTSKKQVQMLLCKKSELELMLISELLWEMSEMQSQKQLDISLLKCLKKNFNLNSTLKSTRMKLLLTLLVNPSTLPKKERQFKRLLKLWKRQSKFCKEILSKNFLVILFFNSITASLFGEDELSADLRKESQQRDMDRRATS